MARILMLTHWTGGDVFPFMKLGKRLQKNGHEVILFSHCVYESYAVADGLGFVAIDDKTEYDDMNRDLYLLEDPVHSRQNTLDFFDRYHNCDRMIREYKAMEQYIIDGETIILSRHRSSVAGLLLAEKKRIPVASVSLAPNYFDHMELHNQLFGKEMCDEINKARAILELSSIEDWKSWLYSPAFLGFWPEWFARAEEEWPEHVKLIGYVDEKKPKEELEVAVTEFLKEHEKVVLISGGTSTLLNKDFYRVGCDAVEACGYYGIAVVTHEEHMPTKKYDNILFVKSICMESALEQVDAIIHHGGMGTLSEACREGVPQVILAHLIDRPDNAARLKKVGIAEAYSPKDWENIEKIAEGIKEVTSIEFTEHCKDFAAKVIEEEERFDYNGLIDELLHKDIYILNGVKKKADVSEEKTQKLTAKQIYLLLQQKKEKK